MTYDDPFIVRINISRLQSLLSAEMDDAARRSVTRVLAEFEAVAAKIGMDAANSAGIGRR